MTVGVEPLPLGPGVRTIERGLGVLDSFTAERRSWRTSELARHRGLPIATTHRILRVLEQYGYLTRDRESGAYRLGPSAASFAREDPCAAELARIAAPAVGAVHRATGEHAVLSALSESRDHRVEVCVAASSASEMGRKPPEPRPLHAGASAKVLLAQLSNGELDRLVGRGLGRVGPATITRPSRLRREVAAIRRRGWAFSREETAAGSWAVAVTVPGAAQAPVAIGVTAPLERFEAAAARRYLALLAGTARRVSATLARTNRSREETLND